MTRRGVGALAGALIVAFAVPSVAAGHAYLVRSHPADGARLGSSPPRVELGFSEGVSRTLSTAKLVGARTGRVFAPVSIRGTGARLILAFPKLPNDTYSLDWRTVSTDDLHSTEGSLVFAVGTAAPLPSGQNEASPTVSGPDRVEVVLRWIDFGAIAGLIGALVLLGVCMPRAVARGAELEDARRRLIRLALIVGTLALGTGAGLLLLQAGAADDGLSAVATVLGGTTYGATWIVRELLIGLLLVLVLVFRRRSLSGFLVALSIMGSAGVCIALALTSHSAAARGQVSLASAALALHLLAVCVWAGGVCVLALIMFRGRSAEGGTRSATLLFRSFGGLAVLCVAVVALTGLYSAKVDVGSPAELVTTSYGRTLLVKTGLFLLVGVIGFANASLLRRERPGRRWLTRGVRLEAAAVTTVILLAAILTATAPASGRRDARIVPAPPADRVESVVSGDLLLSLAVKPNQPGENFVTVGVFNMRRPAPAPIGSVELAIGNRAAWVKASRIGGQRWRLTGKQLSRPGTWSIRVRVQRRDLPDRITRLNWKLQAPTTS